MSKPYLGRCIGGPRHDEWPEDYVTSFHTVSLKSFGWDPKTVLTSVSNRDYHPIVYIWSRSLGCWCMMEE